MRGTPRARWFWATLVLVVASDWLSKRAAEQWLAPAGLPHDVLGNAVRLTLVYNRNAAMGLSAGSWSRWFFAGAAVVALGVVAWFYRDTRPGERWRALTLGLIAAGALGNLLDRLRGPQGVVDFMDVGTPHWRFWTFNVADSAITIGVALIILGVGQRREQPTDPGS